MDYVHGANGVFIVHNNASYENIKKILEPSIININSTKIGLEKFQFSSKSFPMTSWFAGQLLPGERTTATFTIDNPTNNTLTINLEPKNISLIKNSSLDGQTIPQQQDSILNKTGVFSPNYVKLSDVRDNKELGDFFDIQNQIPDDTSLMILNLNFPFTQFMNSTADIYADDLKISSLYLYDWIDKNNNTEVTSDELSMINRAGSWGTVQELRVSEPKEKFEGMALVGVYPVPSRYSYWLGDTNQNSTSMDYTLSASYYKNDNWSVLWPDSKVIQVPPNNSASVDVTLIVPDHYQTGIYQGFLNFKSDIHSVNAPVSFVVKESVTKYDSVISVEGILTDDVLYGNGFTKGAFDMSNRYMAGDWRQYYFDIQNDLVDTAIIELSWNSDDTNFGMFVMDPSGKIIQTNVPSGVFGHFLGWPSLDWLGNSLFSQGGGFYPVKNKDNTSTVLNVPINQTGTYSLLTHSTLFGGNSTTEPIALKAKFTNLSSDTISNSESILLSESMAIDIENSTKLTEPDNSNIEISNNDRITNFNDTNDSDFEIGLIIGIIVGVAIGITLLFIIRQKNT